ncbi:MAG: hypothetical protein KDK70_05210, partial [Myxococcales bacterium]|nr:hypothetical protein [Myxococcales bacterium]
VGMGALWSPGTAAANPDVTACAGKAAGDPCGLTKLVAPPGGGELERKTVPGACRDDECCDLDYSKGSPPQTTCHACLVCKEGPAEPAAPASPTASGPGHDQGEPPRSGSEDPPAIPPSEKSGCRVGTPSPAGPLGAWLVVLGVIGRRRRR